MEKITLKTPFQSRNLVLKNRLVMPPMATAKAEKDDSAGQKLCDYYAEKARESEIGLIITEHSYISLAGKAHSGQLSVSKDSDVNGLKRLVDAIHQNNSIAMAQISHAGGAASADVTGFQPVSASEVDIAALRNGSSTFVTLSREMTKEEIHRTAEEFARAAVRVKEAGFDGVEIHAAHGYLLNQFYSPLSNRRLDEYGTTLAGRLRFLLETASRVRESVGSSFLVAVRLGACDYRDGGTTISDSIQAAKELEKNGVDLLDISGGFCSYQKPGATEQGYFSDITKEIKKAVQIPVILTGGITEICAADRLLDEGAADLIGVGRALLKNSCFFKY